MKTGLEILLANETLLRTLGRTAVLAHAASMTNKGEHIVLALKQSGVNVARVFTPEHGLWGAAQDMEGVDHGFDEIINQDVVSLYGHSLASLTPADKMLDDLDDIIIDVQDVGARYYTFAYTALFLAQAALGRGLNVYIVDRPNPINAHDIEGNLIEPAFHSFVGMRSSMTRHGMTLGEMMTMWCTEEKTPNIGNMHVCWMQDYDRRHYYDDTHCIWTMPSPNMPAVETAVVYPGMCLIEGTNLSEGRGTTRPFELIGAPWVKARAVIGALACLDLPGIIFRPVDFKPMFQKHAHQVCHGVQLHVTDRAVFKPVLAGIALLCVMRALHEEFDWRREVYEFVGDRLAIDLLFGNDRVRKDIEKQANPYHIADQMNAESEPWRSLRDNYLYYR